MTYIQELHVAMHNFPILDRWISMVVSEIVRMKILRGLQTRPAEQSNESLRPLLPKLQYDMKVRYWQRQSTFLSYHRNSEIPSNRMDRGNNLNYPVHNQSVSMEEQFVLHLNITNSIILAYFILFNVLHSASLGHTHPLALAEKCSPGLQLCVECSTPKTHQW